MISTKSKRCQPNQVMSYMDNLHASCQILKCGLHSYSFIFRLENITQHSKLQRIQDKDVRHGRA